MELTPLDIHHKEFHRAIRGYNEEEVDVFLDQVADEFERLFNQNRDLKEQVEKMQDKVKQYEGIEHTLQKALLTAQQAADEVQANAQKESELIIKDAELKSKEIIQDIVNQKQNVQADLNALEDAEKEFRSKFKELLSSYLDVIAKIEKGERPEPEKEAHEAPPAAEEAPVFAPPETEAAPEVTEPVKEEPAEAEPAAPAEAEPEIMVMPEESQPQAETEPGEETAGLETATGEEQTASPEAEEKGKKPKTSEDFEDFFDKSTFFSEEEDKTKDEQKEENKSSEEDPPASETGNFNSITDGNQSEASPAEPQIRYDYPEPGDEPDSKSEIAPNFFDDNLGSNDSTPPNLPDPNKPDIS